ncbi:MAG: DNA polymerase III subunit delta' [Chloroflexi bacterium]|nr:DNA polymerase III subunit delta' [Chloroflexota bacterium]
MSHTNWQSIIGHDWAVQLLAGAIEHDRVGHAYLITGPEHVGKTTLARTFAQALNCEAGGKAQAASGKSSAPCGECRACKLIANDRHLDVRLVEPEVSGRGKLSIKIETIRELTHGLSLAAFEARRKVAILSRFDTATIGASNAFLKTLEEPPRNVALLLTATDADTLLPTISSRCRTIGLRPLPTETIEQALATRYHVPADDAHLLAHLADGRIGWAIQAAQDAAILDARAENIDWLHEALRGNRVARFALADKLARKPERLPAILQDWLSWQRDLTVLTQGIARNGVALTNIDQQAELERHSRAWTPEQALASLKQTNLALWQLERNANTRLVLENLLLIFPFAKNKWIG